MPDHAYATLPDATEVAIDGRTAESYALASISKEAPLKKATRRVSIDIVRLARTMCPDVLKYFYDVVMSSDERYGFKEKHAAGLVIMKWGLGNADVAVQMFMSNFTQVNGDNAKKEDLGQDVIKGNPLAALSPDQRQAYLGEMAATLAQAFAPRERVKSEYEEVTGEPEPIEVEISTEARPGDSELLNGSGIARKPFLKNG